MDKVICGDGLSVLDGLEEKSAQMILTDPPYGITSNKWDRAIDMGRFWVAAKRAIAENGVIVMTASQPFTSDVVSSNRNNFKHEWIWIKNRGSNFANTCREPFKEHESVLVFAGKRWKYNPIMQERTGGGVSRVEYGLNYRSKSENYREFEGRENQTCGKMRLPSSWQKFNTQVGLHPTQKPVDLMAYLISTYTDEGDLVVDPFCGSGTVCVAARSLNRRFLGCDINEDYVRIANGRLV